MLPPHAVVRDAVRIARKLADQARRAGEPDHAAYFDRIAAEAECRANLLQALQSTRRRNRLELADRSWAPRARGAAPKITVLFGARHPCNGQHGNDD